ncbi:MAG TPA: hypothetical protein EYP59_08555, partial [Thiotrichaceae bacterium]|nr:hypothetical protein [Thiotrichaceae bacterium]
MSTTLFRQALSTLLNSAIVDYLASVTNNKKAVDLLKEHFTFTAAEMAQHFQKGYAYALTAISSSLTTPESQQGIFKIFQSNINHELATRIEQDYLQPFAQQQGLMAPELKTFRQTAAEQCLKLAKRKTIFQADNVPFSEAELARFVTSNGATSITDLILENIQADLDERVIALLRYNALLGNALLFFLHEQLRKEDRFNNTLAALQREGLLIDVREIKKIVQANEAKLNQALAAKQFGEVAQLGQALERLQHVESIAQTHYAQFLEFSQRFANWAQLLNVQLEELLNTTGAIKNDTENILAILQQLMTRADLSSQIKLRDELTQHNSASLALIKQAKQLLKRIPLSDPQYSRVAIELGSVVSSQGDLKQAEALFSQAYEQANNEDERALSQFNLFQVFIRQQVYDKALSALQAAIKLNPQAYALHNIHSYTLERILGAGGMGCVFLAQHRLKAEQVVIKCFWETLPSSQDQLFQEAFLMAKIAGQYVPQPLDCGFVDLARQQRGYFISEYIEDAIDGETWLKQYGKLDIQTGILVGLQIAKGLQLAHDNGIFHLDLKPANILLQRQDEIGVKIIDFGLAKVAPALGQEMAIQRSRSGLSQFAQAVVFGTMDYAPPEQQGMTAYGKPSAKSDVYAFGKTLYRLLTGESPQTLHPRRLAEAPELFELLCDCVEVEPEKRVKVENLIGQLMALLSIKNKRLWWNELDDDWKEVFKEVIFIEGEPTDSDLEEILQLQELDCALSDSSFKIASLEALRALTNLKHLNCNFTQISDLEPLRALMNLQALDCSSNHLSDLEPLRALTNLHVLFCSENQLS